MVTFSKTKNSNILFLEKASEGVLSRVNSHKLESRQATVESLQMDEDEEEKEPEEEEGKICIILIIGQI